MEENDLSTNASTLPVPDSHKKELDSRLKSLGYDSPLTLDELKSRVDKRITK